MRSDFRQIFEREVSPHVFVRDSQVVLLEEHYRLLLRWNQRLNLTARVDVEEAVIRHYGESLFLGNQIDGRTIADIGSGPGFPGIPIAILRPEWRVTVVESDRRKAVFLRESTQRLDNVNVHVGRHDTLQGGFDWVVSRAVKAEDAIEAAQLYSRHIALICSAGLKRSNEIVWNQEIKIPWPGSGIVCIGDVPRETRTDCQIEVRST